MPTNLENSAVATGLEKVSFHSNLKERQCKKAKWLYEEALQIAVKRRDARSKKQRRKGKIHASESRVPKNSKESLPQ